MLVLRSLVFNVLFYANLVLWLLIGVLPALALPKRVLLAIAIAWSRSSLWLLRVVAGTRCEISGIEHIPQGGLMIAAKHQSFLETFALVTVFRNPVFILKRELTWIPVFGWALGKLRMIPVNRGARARALSHVTRRAKVELGQNGRQLLIFPEGTRRAPGAPRPTSSASPISMPNWASPAYPSRSIPACSGRDASSCAGRVRSASRSCRRSPPVSTRSPSSTCCRSGSRSPATGCWLRAGPNSAPAASIRSPPPDVP